MMNNTIRPLFSQLGILTLTFLITFSCFGSDLCRNENKEGWAWASSLNYKTKDGSFINFEPIHSRLSSRHNTIQQQLKSSDKGPSRNVIVAELNFVLEPDKGGTPELVENLDSIAQQIKIDIPLSNHIFVSGKDKPNFNAKFVQSFTELERAAESDNKWKRYTFTPFQIALELKDSPHIPTKERIEQSQSNDSTAQSSRSATDNAAPHKKTRQKSAKKGAKPSKESLEQNQSSASQSDITESLSALTSEEVDDVAGIATNSTAQPTKKNQPAVKNSEPTEALDEPRGRTGNDQDLLSNFIFIHPERTHFTYCESMVQRLLQRYSGIKKQDLPIKALLAEAWLKTKKEPSGPLQLWHRARYQRPICTLAERQQEWFRETDKPWPPHQKNDAKAQPETENAFFSNIYDSEQKLFYYLDYVTSFTEEYAYLISLMDRIEQWFEESGQEARHLLNFLMDYSAPYDAELIKAIKNAQAKPINQNASSHKIMKDVQNFIESIHTLQEKFGHDTYRLNKLEEYAEVVRATLQDLRSTKFVLPMGYKLAIGSAWFKKNKDDIKAMDDQTFKNELFRQRTNMARADLASDHIKRVLEWSKKDAFFKALRSAREFAEDELLVNFSLLAREILRKNPGKRIAAVVLNLHSTFDACFGCGPDLARESLRMDSFGGYFARIAQKINGALGGTPFFRIVYSCKKVRDDIQCCGCKFADKTQVEPVWSKPDKIAFYQHHFEKPSNLIDLSDFVSPQAHTVHRDATKGKDLNNNDDDDDNDDDEKPRTDKRREEKKPRETTPLLSGDKK